MSEMETAKGRVRFIWTPEGTEFQKAQYLVESLNYHFEDYDIEMREARDPQFLFIKGEWYRVENVSNLDSFGFSEVKEIDVGLYEFICHWYNGGGSLEEVIEGGMKDE